MAVVYKILRHSTAKYPYPLFPSTDICFVFMDCDYDSVVFLGSYDYPRDLSGTAHWYAIAKKILHLCRVVMERSFRTGILGGLVDILQPRYKLIRLVRGTKSRILSQSSSLLRAEA